MQIETIAKFVNTIGLAFDIAGALFIAWEVFSPLKGVKFVAEKDPLSNMNLGQNMSDKNPATRPHIIKDSVNNKLWVLKIHRRIKTGLVLLIIGLLLQISSIWTPYCGPYNITMKQTKNTPNATNISPMNKKFSVIKNASKNNNAARRHPSENK